MIRINFFLSAMLFGALGLQQVATLDLTTAVSQPRFFEPVSGSASGGGIGSGAPESSREQQPVQLSFSELQATWAGDELRVRYEVDLKNISDHVISVPWSPSPRAVEPIPPHPYAYEMGSLRLTIAGTSEAKEVPESVSIFGSQDSGTLRELSVGEWVTIRGETKLEHLSKEPGQLSNGPPIKATWSQFDVTVDGPAAAFHETLSQVGGEISAIR